MVVIVGSQSDGAEWYLTSEEATELASDLLRAVDEAADHCTYYSVTVMCDNKTVEFNVKPEMRNYEIEV